MIDSLYRFLYHLFGDLQFIRQDFLLSFLSFLNSVLFKASFLRSSSLLDIYQIRSTIKIPLHNSKMNVNCKFMGYGIQTSIGFHKKIKGLSILVISYLNILDEQEMSLVAKKPVFRVSNQVRLKPVSTATETS